MIAQRYCGVAYGGPRAPALCDEKVTRYGNAAKKSESRYLHRYMNHSTYGPQQWLYDIVR